MKLVEKIKLIAIQLLEDNTMLTVENFMKQSNLSLIDCEQEILDYLSKSQMNSKIGIHSTIVLRTVGKNTIEYDGKEVMITDGWKVDYGYFDKGKNVIRYDSSYMFRSSMYRQALKSANYYGIKSFY